MDTIRALWQQLTSAMLYHPLALYDALRRLTPAERAVIVRWLALADEGR